MPWLAEFTREWRDTPLVAWPVKLAVLLVFVAYWLFAAVYEALLDIWFRN